MATKTFSVEVEDFGRIVKVFYTMISDGKYYFGVPGHKTGVTEWHRHVASDEVVPFLELAIDEAKILARTILGEISRPIDCITKTGEMLKYGWSDAERMDWLEKQKAVYISMNDPVASLDVREPKRLRASKDNAIMGRWKRRHEKSLEVSDAS